MSDYLRKRMSVVHELHDDSLMPFGKHEGMRLGDVPDSYWRWFLRQDWCEQHPDLCDYAEGDQQ